MLGGAGCSESAQDARGMRGNEGFFSGGPVAAGLRPTSGIVSRLTCEEERGGQGGDVVTQLFLEIRTFFFAAWERR